MNLSELNPWWVNREEINKDQQIVDFSKKKYQYWPPLVSQEFKADNVYSLRGPRQLGKTTALKLIVRRLLLEEKKEPRSVFFWSCEDINDYASLVELVKEYLEIAPPDSPKYLLLDEISFVKEWQRGVKLLVDRGYLKGCCLIITGSNVMDIKRSVEKLPGRRGKEGRDFIMLPLDFSEFCHVLGFGQKISSPADFKAVDIKLRDLFRKYFVTGGFPLVINELIGEKNNPGWLKEIYYSWIIGDLLRSGRSEKVALQILSSILRKQPSALSWDSLAKDAEVKSHLTVSSYVETFEEMFVLSVNYFYELERKNFNPNKNKKIHFLDNYIYTLFCEKTKQKVNEDVIYEDLVCSALIKQYKNVFYTSQKKELDFVIVLNREEIGVEVKNQQKISSSDYLSFLPVKKGIMVTKDIFEKKELGYKKYWAVPIHWFLYLSLKEWLRILK